MSEADASLGLDQIWASEIPLSQDMGVRVVAWTGSVLTVEAPLAPNINVHGTAFAGSLYAVGALCGWGLTHLRCSEARQPGSIVIASASIDYRSPCEGNLIARAEWADQDTAWQRYLDSGKSRFTLQIDISGAATLTGEYAVRAQRPAD